MKMQVKKRIEIQLPRSRVRVEYFDQQEFSQSSMILSFEMKIKFSVKLLVLVSVSLQRRLLEVLGIDLESFSSIFFYDDLRRKVRQLYRCTYKYFFCYKMV